MAKPFSELTQAEQRAFLNQSSAQKVDQTVDFLSSDITLQVGLKLISRAEFDNWLNKEYVALGNEIRASVYKTADQHETDKVYASMRADGVKFVDSRRANWSSQPATWEIEKYVSSPKYGGKTLITLKKAKDAHSFHRHHVLLADLVEHYTTQTVEDLVAFEFETTKSTWALKSGAHRTADVFNKTQEITKQVADDIGPAARLVAEVANFTPYDMAQKMADTAFRDRFLSAKRLVAAAKAFK